MSDSPLGFCQSTEKALNKYLLKDGKNKGRKAGRETANTIRFIPSPLTRSHHTASDRWLCKWQLLNHFRKITFSVWFTGYSLGPRFSQSILFVTNLMCHLVQLILNLQEVLENTKQTESIEQLGQRNLLEWFGCLCYTMTEALAGIHSGVMDILVWQKSVLGNISDEMNYSRIEKLYQKRKEYLVTLLFNLLMALPLLLRGTFSSEQKIFAWMN